MLYTFRLWVYRYVYGMAYCCHSTKQSHWSTSRNVIHRQNFHPPSSWYHRSVYPKCHAFVLVEAVSVRQVCAQCIRHELVVCLVPYLETGWDQRQFNIIKRQNGTGSSAVVTRATSWNSGVTQRSLVLSPFVLIALIISDGSEMGLHMKRLSTEFQLTLLHLGVSLKWFAYRHCRHCKSSPVMTVTDYSH